MGSLNRLVTKIDLDMTGEVNRYMVSAKQGDKRTRFVIANLLNDGSRYEIPEGVQVYVNVKKPDGKRVYNTCEYSGSEITIGLTNQMLAAAGTAYCDIEIRTNDSSEIISSASFTMEIEETLRSETAIMSTNEFTALEKYFEKLEETDREIVERENARNAAEEERREAEEERREREQDRAANEEKRIQNEELRQKSSEEAIQAVNTATQEAGQAIEDCRSVTERAEAALMDQEQLEETVTEIRQINEEVREKTENIDESVRLAEQYAIRTHEAEVNALDAQESAEASKSEADTSAQRASAAAQEASEATTEATTAATSASGSATAAAQSAGAAAGSATAASESAESADESATRAESSKTAAETAKTAAEDSAEDSEAWAVGQRGGVDVPSTDPTYQNSAKYWAERAKEVASVDIMTQDANGIGRPDGTSLTVDESGELSGYYVCKVTKLPTENIKRFPTVYSVYSGNDNIWLLYEYLPESENADENGWIQYGAEAEKIEIMTESANGIGRPDGTSIKVDETGKLSGYNRIDVGALPTENILRFPNVYSIYSGNENIYLLYEYKPEDANADKNGWIRYGGSGGTEPSEYLMEAIHNLAVKIHFTDTVGTTDTITVHNETSGNDYTVTDNTQPLYLTDAGDYTISIADQNCMVIPRTFSISSADLMTHKTFKIIGGRRAFVNGFVGSYVNN